MSVRLCRWGNSTGLRLSTVVLEAAGLKAGDYVHIRLLDGGDIRVRPVKQAIAAEPDSSAAAATPDADDESVVW